LFQGLFVSLDKLASGKPSRDARLRFIVRDGRCGTMDPETSSG
jgi:hypothetical protein